MSVLQRDAVRTRRALLDAAARAVAEHGPGVSLEVIARSAGVSKGGLLHHFPSKDALLEGLADEWIRHFEESVERHLDPADDKPGRVCRAHIRASFDSTHPADEILWQSPDLLLALLSTPGVKQRARQSDRRWRADMTVDGLHPQRVSVISKVLDGLTMADMLTGSTDPAERAITRDLLLALTHDTGPLVSGHQT